MPDFSGKEKLNNKSSIKKGSFTGETGFVVETKKAKTFVLPPRDLTKSKESKASKVSIQKISDEKLKSNIVKKENKQSSILEIDNLMCDEEFPVSDFMKHNDDEDD